MVKFSANFLTIFYERFDEFYWWIFFDKLFCRICLTNFFDDVFDEFFDKFFDEVFDEFKKKLKNFGYKVFGEFFDKVFDL